MKESLQDKKEDYQSPCAWGKLILPVTGPAYAALASAIARLPITDINLSSVSCRSDQSGSIQQNANPKDTSVPVRSKFIISTLVQSPRTRKSPFVTSDLYERAVDGKGPCWLPLPTTFKTKNSDACCFLALSLSLSHHPGSFHLSTLQSRYIIIQFTSTNTYSVSVLPPCLNGESKNLEVGVPFSSVWKSIGFRGTWGGRRVMILKPGRYKEKQAIVKKPGKLINIRINSQFMSFVSENYF